MSLLQLVKVVAPATPAANEVVIYYDTADNLMKSKDYLGTVTIFGGAGATFLPPRVTSTASSATPTPNADTTDAYDLTAQAAAAAFANPTGTPVNFQKLIIRIKDNGTARGLTWGSAYVAGGVALPSTTVLSKILTLGFIYNTANGLAKWQLVASAQES